MPTHHEDYDAYSDREGERQRFGPWLSQNAGVLAVLVAIFIQTTGAVWWASSVTTQIIAQQQVNKVNADAILKLTTIVEQNAERMTKVETVQENVVKILDMISDRQIRSSPPDGQPRGPSIPRN